MKPWNATIFDRERGLPELTLPNFRRTLPAMPIREKPAEFATLP